MGHKENKSEHIKKKLLTALERSLGVVTTACRQSDIGRTTFYKYYKEDLEFKEKVDDISNIALDFAESQLHQLMQGDSPNPTSVIFYLKTKGKHRGYVEKQQLDVTSNDEKITIEFNLDSEDNSGTNN
jgi:hypothetical protein